MKYTKPSIKLNDYLIDERIAAYSGVDLSLGGLQMEDFEGAENEAW